MRLPRCREVGLSNGHILFHDREVGFTRRFGILRLPRCCEVGYIQRLYNNSMAVTVGYSGFCHGDVRLVSSDGYMLSPRP